MALEINLVASAGRVGAAEEVVEVDPLPYFHVRRLAVAPGHDFSNRSPSFVIHLRAPVCYFRGEVRRVPTYSREGDAPGKGNVQSYCQARRSIGLPRRHFRRYPFR